ncbi:Uncharacterised protein [Serratia quinivorans]|nr:Uncharacterised protein [Serratia quinivorans]CAI1712749.1 Uncharacterised protein [Serratia quinivorans]
MQRTIKMVLVIIILASVRVVHANVIVLHTISSIEDPSNPNNRRIYELEGSYHMSDLSAIERHSAYSRVKDSTLVTIRIRIDGATQSVPLVEVTIPNPNPGTYLPATAYLQAAGVAMSGSIRTRESVANSSVDRVTIQVAVGATGTSYAFMSLPYAAPLQPGPDSCSIVTGGLTLDHGVMMLTGDVIVSDAEATMAVTCVVPQDITVSLVSSGITMSNPLHSHQLLFDGQEHGVSIPGVTNRSVTLTSTVFAHRDNNYEVLGRVSGFGVIQVTIH